VKQWSNTPISTPHLRRYQHENDTLAGMQRGRSAIITAKSTDWINTEFGLSDWVSKEVLEWHRDTITLQLFGVNGETMNII
jgi:hypothetical protein